MPCNGPIYLNGGRFGKCASFGSWGNFGKRFERACPLDLGQDFTILLWVYLTPGFNPGNDDYAQILSMSDPNANLNLYFTSYVDEGEYWGLYFTGYAWGATFIDQPQAGAWYQLAVTHAELNDHISLYCNGALAVEYDDLEWLYSDVSSMVVGLYGGPYVDELLGWQRVLTPQDIRRNYAYARGLLL